MIVWDEPKRAANLAKHGIDFADIGAEFFLSALVTDARSPRRKALGILDGQELVVVFQVYGTEAISIISARRAGRRDRP
ncbi:MAG: BrnT family toxin [Paracoccaceae bacterium]